ncbi:fumarylacetoacetase [Vulcanimicrobium alpinum]|uniref:fumarylacetoacetase n=1 Tax=Vulcanimicrobium alpinum TaxID=3016050 RepID=A0AAN1XXQ9_UNVUL|nr:fumarylacetoacetase [Vulcanimicrobium alpinum]BDE06187.1 fumarylacetoacetase [Vulcanimicrobium alpinum]
MIDPRDFGIDNLPLGIVADDAGRARPAVAYRDLVVDLDALVHARAIDEQSLADASSLNAFLGRGPAAWTALRARLQHLLGERASAEERRAVAAASHPHGALHARMPVQVGDYVDFYSSLEHATSLGRILRPGGEPLPPNYRHIPIGYHGRSGTVVISETPIRRPAGQTKAGDAAAPEFGPSQMLDVELEMGWIAGPGNALGAPIPADAVREHVYGYVLLNDWSARDIQGWEYQPLGPFLSKSFATSISPWIVSLEALEPFRVAEPPREPEPLRYLRASQPFAYDVELDLLLLTRAMAERGDPPFHVSRTNLRGMYWTVAQQLAHVTANGATIRPGDLFGTGTISGFEPGTQGSLIERTWRGRDPLALPGGETRAFLENGDTAIVRGRAVRGDLRIGFGEVVGTIVA